MHRHRELIYRPHSLKCIPVSAQYLKISRQCRTVTAYIHDFLRLHFYDRVKQRLIAALAGRIYHNHICAGLLPAVFFLISFIISRQNFLRLSHKELCIFNPVKPGVSPCILDCLRYDLHSIHLSRFLCKEQRDCPDPAVQIPHSLAAFQICVFQSKRVQLLRLYRINLVKRQRRNLIPDLSDIICNIPLPPQYFKGLSHNYVCTACVHTDCNSGHSRNCGQRLYEIPCIWNRCPVDHETDHDLSCSKSITDQYMTDQPRPCPFIVGRNVMLFHEFQDTLQYLLINRNSQCTVCIRDNVMCSPCIEAGNRMPFFIRAEGELSFIAVAERFLHSDSRFRNAVKQFRREAADALQTVPHFLFLKCQLPAIGHFLDLAAAALTRESASRLHTVWRRLQHTHQPCISVVFLCFYNLHFSSVADHGVFYKERVAVDLSDSFAAHADIRNLDNCHIILLHFKLPTFSLSWIRTACYTRATLSRFSP